MYAGRRGDGTGPDSCTIQTSVRPKGSDSARALYAESFGFCLPELPRYYLYAGCIDLALTFSDVLYLRPTCSEQVESARSGESIGRGVERVPRVQGSLSDEARPRSVQVDPSLYWLQARNQLRHGNIVPVTPSRCHSTQHRQPRRQGSPPDGERQWDVPVDRVEPRQSFLHDSGHRLCH